MKELFATIIALCVLLALIIGLGCCVNQKQNEKQNDSYNNGICPICETPFHFVNVTYKTYSGYQYVYACDNEHVIICAQEQHQEN